MSSLVMGSANLRELALAARIAVELLPESCLGRLQSVAQLPSLAQKCHCTAARANPAPPPKGQ